MVLSKRHDLQGKCGPLPAYYYVQRSRLPGQW